MTVSLDAVINDVCEFMQGSCKNLGDAIEAFTLDVDEEKLEQALLERDVELCGHCGWWHETCELEFNEEHGAGLCENCREELGIEEQ